MPASVLCVITALLLQLLLNISLLCYIAGGEDYQVFNAAWKYDEWHYLTRDEDYRKEAVRVTIIALLCELPHLLAWLLYIWARFYPSRSDDVVIAPGFVQAKKEAVEKIQKEEKDKIKVIEEEKYKRALDEEERRIIEMEEAKALHRRELEISRNFLMAVKRD